MPRKKSHPIFKRLAVLAFLTVLCAGIVVPAVVFADNGSISISPDPAVHCTEFHVTEDANKNSVIQNAENFKSPADTCFTFGKNAEMTLVRTLKSSSRRPTSYPNNDYGCGSSDCTSGWKSELWSTPRIKITGAISSKKMQTGTRADLLVDSLFTTNPGGKGAKTKAEIEIVTWATPSYSNLGFCTKSTCGVKVTLANVSWWRQERNNGGVPDWIYVREFMKQDVTRLPLDTFYKNANNTKFLGGLDRLVLNKVAFGNELWEKGTGLQIVTTRATSIP